MLLVNKTKAQLLARRAKSFAVIGVELYRKSRTGILQRCIPTKQGKSYKMTSTVAPVDITRGQEP
jgi:hypothetical protein